MRRRSTSKEFVDKLQSSEEYAMFYNQVQDTNRKESSNSSNDMEQWVQNSSNSSSGGTGSDSAPLLGANAAEGVEDVAPIIKHSSFSRAAMHYLENQIAFKHHMLLFDQERRDIPLTHRLHALKNGHTLYSAMDSKQFGRPSASTGMRVLTGEDGTEKNAGDHKLAGDSDGYNLRTFCRAVDEETDHLDTPSDMRPPCCECDKPSELRRFLRPHHDSTVEYHVWVCAGRNCMLWLGSDHFPPKRTCSNWELFHASSASSVNLHCLIDHTTGEILQGETSEDVFDEVHKKFQEWDELTPEEKKEALAKFWANADPHMVTIDEEAIGVLLQNQTVRKCDCGVDCSVALDKTSGDLFWTCKNRTCMLIWLCAERPALAQLDVGQYHGIGRGSIDRYTTVQYIMRWCGRTFSRAFFKKLMKRGPDVDFPEGALKLEPGEEYDAFISYRGGTGKFLLWITMCGMWHMMPAFWYLCGFLPILVLAMSFIKDPCGSGVPIFFLGSKSCDPPAPGPLVTLDDLIEALLKYFPPVPQWFVFRSWGVGVMLAIMLFWFPVMAWTNKNFKIFLDKYCIHQSNEKKNGMGVSRLPLFLKSSKRLYCLFDYNWCSRLWCVFELAVYLRMRPNPKVEFFSITQILTMVACLVLDNVFRMINLFFENSFGDETESSRKFLAWYSWCTDTIIHVVLFLLAQQYFLSQIHLGKQIRNFDVKDAKLAVEEDRVVLLTYIRELFQPKRAGASTVQSRQQDESRHAIRAASRGLSGISNSRASGARDRRTTYLDEVEGINEFNRYVREEVPARLPVSGFKSWIVAWYPSAVLTCMILGRQAQWYDIWAFGLTEATYPPAPNPMFADFGTGCRTFIAFFFNFFVLWPILSYQLGCLIRLFLWVQHRTGLKYWVQVAIFLPIFIVEEEVFALRYQFWVNLQQITVPVIQGDVKVLPEFKYVVAYNPLNGIKNLIDAYDEGAAPATHIGLIEPHGWVKALLWIFLIIPLTILTWIVYEPRWSMRLRRKYWKRMFSSKQENQVAVASQRPPRPAPTTDN